MTQDISSLMDGELEAHEAGRVVQACCASEDQKQTWYVYHVIGDTMRGHAPCESGFPHRTLEALREQPTVLAPRRRIVDTAFTRIALAAAASVVTVGVVGWLGLQGGQIGDRACDREGDAAFGDQRRGQRPGQRNGGGLIERSPC